MRHGHDRSLNADPLPPKFGPGYFNLLGLAGVIDFADFSKNMVHLLWLFLMLPKLTDKELTLAPPPALNMWGDVGHIHWGFSNPCSPDGEICLSNWNWE